MDLLPAQRDLHRGFGDTLSRAFEFAGAIAIFLFLGWRLDRWVGTQPLFMIVFVVFALTGLTVKLWYAYDLQMRQHEQRLRGDRHP